MPQALKKNRSRHAKDIDDAKREEMILPRRASRMLFKRLIFKTLIPCCLLCVFWSWFCAAENANITMLPLTSLGTNAGADHWKYTIPLLVKSQLREVANLPVTPDRSLEFLPDSSVEFAFHELNIVGGGVNPSPSEVREVGHLTGAKTVIWGCYRKERNTWVVRMQAINLNDGSTSQFSAASPDWSNVVTNLTSQIVKCVAPSRRSVEFPPKRERVTCSSQALESFSRAFAGRVEGKSLSEVEALLISSVTIDPNFSMANSALAYLLFIQGEHQEAGTRARQAIATRPDSAAPHYVLGSVLVDEGFLDEAEKELTIAAGLDGDNPSIHQRLGELYYVQGSWRKAVKAFERAVQAAPWEASVRAELGRAYPHVGKSSKAFTELQMAERYEVNTEVGVNLVMGEAYAQLGDIPKALKNYQKFLMGAAQVGLRSQYLSDAQEVVIELKARLSPHFVHAPPPISLTPEQARASLRERLTRAESLLINDPLAASPEMRQRAGDLAGRAHDDLTRAKELFDRLTSGNLIRQEAVSPLDGVRGNCTAREVFTRWCSSRAALSCQDYTLLYVAMARQIHLKAFYVLVTKDYRGRPAYHACAGVLIGDKALLVDPSNSWFGAPHQDYQFLDDFQAIALFLSEQPSIEKQKLASKLAGTLGVVYLNYALILAETGKERDARAALRTGLGLNPPDWLALYAQAMVELHENDFEKAAQHLRDSLEINPSCAEARSLLLKVLSARRKNEESNSNGHRS